ncbi:receptor-like protein kinase HAIKU2 [Cucurbita pepo subsp. pepo]|uniref:receptor-like protein kinase HAIKU2 n=1 Tax=Cucurbita pepo subsp. pepo TaxID=3664 RepID=UPI000C9D6250|nr:receptor-like protein kinase HAIKU2 [Cucurbita pepo subsp. pepo]
MSSLHFLSLLSLLIAFLTGIKSDDERQILTKLISSLHNTHAAVFQNWGLQNPKCNFTGIACNSHGFVNEINLSKWGLTGVLPFDSVCQLPALEKLILRANSLHGEVTESLNNCVKLKHLDLSSNGFSGSFPDIHSLPELEYLYLNSSGFSGKFPWKSVGNLSGLIELSVGDNPFENATFPVEVTNLKRLNLLYLSNCSLTGEIPRSIGNLTELLSFEFSDNFITGDIPPEIGRLQKLWQLVFYNNQLTGTLPVGLRNLTGLKNFDASLNYIHGDLSELRFLTNLVSLQMFDNQFSGHVPVEFGEFKSLVNLSLYRNRLTGPLPQSIGSWAAFDFIDVSENFLTGSIPPDMCKQGTMQKLLILQNNFSGEIPASYANCSTLNRFRVSQNSLTGVVPSGIWGLPNVNIIDLASNQLVGSITSDIGKAVCLSEFYVGNNRFSGRLPLEISQAESLASVDLSNNQFSDELPMTIGDLKNLDSLELQGNKFSGSIPETIGSCNSLSIVNLADNFFSGQIPSSLGFLPVLNSLNLSNNDLSGEIPSTFSHLKLSLLDLSNNQLSGSIPLSLSNGAYNESFTGNPGLCSETDGFLRRCSKSSGTSKDVRILVIGILVGLILLGVTLWCFIKLRKSDKYRDRSLEKESWDLKSFHVMTFTEDEILDSIKDENLIGKGGSGNVYKVTVGNGKELAVKHIWNTDPYERMNNNNNRSSSPILPKQRAKSLEFNSEVKTLSSIRHVNVVKLYCSITSEVSSMLVYEYMPNGSLWDRLHTSTKIELDWETRYEIAVGAAKGLEYLHHGCDQPVIHRDVKTSNILLDECLKPKIADFGLAKILNTSGFNETSHIIAGTPGYIAPEYGYSYKVDEKSDVYSFGVVLMELVSGKRAIEAEFGENKEIVEWVSNNLKSKESVLKLVDSRIGDAYKEEAIKVLRIGILCTARVPSMRPTMRSVVQMLEEAHPCRLLGILIAKDIDNIDI